MFKNSSEKININDLKTDGDSIYNNNLNLEDIDLYAILNIDHNANLATIQRAYKKLSKVYHPDKHLSNSVHYKDAQDQFMKIKYAYDVLSNDVQRQIYDQFGSKGLIKENWSIVPRTKDPNELRIIYDNYQRIAQEYLEMELTFPETYAIMGIDCTDVFDRYLKEPNEDRYLHPSINIFKVNLSQSVVLGVTTKDQVQLMASCSTRNGGGIGSLTWNWKRFLYPTFNDTWFNLETSVSTDSEISTRFLLSRKFFDSVTVSLGPCLAMPHYFIGIFGIQSKIIWKMTDNISGDIDYVWNLNPHTSATVKWLSTSLKHSIYTSFTLKPDNLSLSAFYIFKYNSKQPKSSNEENNNSEDWNIDEKNEPMKFKIGGQISYRNYYGELGLTRRITRFTNFGIKFIAGVPLGIMAKFKIERGNQTYEFPLMMSEELDPAASFYGAAIPLAVYFAMKSLLYDPWKQREMAKDIKLKRQQYHQELVKRQRDALAAQNLMMDSAIRCFNTESSKHGLVILRAVYGKLNKVYHASSDTFKWPETANQFVSPLATSQNVLDQQSIDVTIPIQVMVEDSQLILEPCRPGHNRSQMQGFYDPCLGLMKTIVADGDSPNDRRQLMIMYRYKDDVYQVIMGDHQRLVIPHMDHLVGPANKLLKNDSNSNQNNNSNASSSS